MNIPIIDDRKFDDLIEEAKALTPYFTPEWKFDVKNPDVGTALFMVVALQLQETLDLMNKSLYKNFISFLNYMDVKLTPPRAAKVPLVIELSEGTNRSLALKRGITAIAKDPLTDEQVKFETDSVIEVSPSKIQGAYGVSGEKDYINEILNFSEDFDLFSGEDVNLQEHGMYISHNYLLTCESEMEFELIFEYPYITSKIELDRLGDRSYIVWSFNSGEEWVEFDTVSVKKNRLRLTKNSSKCIDKNPYYDSRWIRGILQNEKINEMENIVIDGVKIRAILPYHSKAATNFKMYYNNKGLSNDFAFPFGDFFNVYDNFYMCSNEVFSKVGAKVDISFNLELVENTISKEEQKINWKPVMRASDIFLLDPPVVSIYTVKWEYWDGIIWKKIPIDKQYERVFYYLNEVKRCKVSFVCPKDIKMVEVNGETSYFIRATIERIENILKVNGTYKSPKISEINMDFKYDPEGIEVEKFIIKNNLEENDMYNSISGDGVLFRPFHSMKYDGNALYVHMNKPLINGPINLLFLVHKSNNMFVYNKKVIMQYFAGKGDYEGWEEVKTFDETAGLTQNGIISFSGLNDFKEIKMLGKKGYWLRFLFDKEDDLKRYIKGIYINGVWATQQESIEKEFIDFSEEKEEIYLRETPILECEIWVDEFEHLSREEMNIIIEEKNLNYKIDKDDMGIINRLWINYNQVEEFSSYENERQYKLDEISGKIEFGEDIRRTIPQARLRESIYADYRVGGGKAGNIPEDSIQSFEDPIAFIGKVFNPDKGEGGNDIEVVEDAVYRAVKKIRHRNRGVTIRDIEDLVLEVSNDIYKAKCISNVNNEMEREDGAINVIVLLREKVLGGISYELKSSIEDYLKNKIPYNIHQTKKVYISDPKVIRVDMNISVTIESGYDKVLVRDNTFKKINDFLNYKTGNLMGQGWEIGEVPRDSVFNNILMDIEGVININDIKMNLYNVSIDRTEEVFIKDVLKMRNCIIMNGNHRIEVNSIT